LALVILGNLPAGQLGRYADTAVATAAKPVLGQIGYTIVAIGGLLATASATNATMFSILNLNASLSEASSRCRSGAANFTPRSDFSLLWPSR
jgi:amino acid transporter